MAVVSAARRPALGQQAQFLRIATGPADTSYFAVGTLIGNVVSSPPGARECERGGSCGVPGLIAVTQSTAGPLANVELIAGGRVESALCQADIAYWAFHGTGLFRRQGAVRNLRAIANLYPETMHIVVRPDRKIDDFRRLRGKTVGLGQKESATLATARTMLQAFGVSEREIKAVHLDPLQAASALREGRIDAFFHMAGIPSPLVRELAAEGAAALLPLPGPASRMLQGAYPFFTESVIPAETYQSLPEIPSVSVGVLWAVDAEVDEKIVHGLTRALFHPNNRRALDAGHPFGRHIQLSSALDGVALQVHAGTALYYFEAGLIR